MSDFLKGNFKVKNPVKGEKEDKSKKKDDNSEPTFMDEYKRKAIQSVAGSMVFVEKELMTWDPETENPEDGKDKK